MNEALHLSLQWPDWLALFSQYLMLSLLSVGGAISTTSEMHRFLVDQHHWLTHAQFTASIAIAQAAPGPNVLFVALMGWNVGVNAGSLPAAVLGMTLCMVGALLPSTMLTYLAAQWGHRNRQLRAVRAFRQGMAPIVIALLIATGWVMASGNSRLADDSRLWLLTAISALLVWRTRLHILWMLGAGALLGWFGWV